MSKFSAKNVIKLSFLGSIVAVAKADVIFPLTFVFIPYFPLVVVPEVATLYFVGGRLGVDVNVKAFVTVVAANVISSFLGLFLFHSDEECRGLVSRSFFVLRSGRRDALLSRP